MAINQVIAPNSVPTVVGDYVAQNAHLMGFMTQVNMQAFVLTDPTTADKPKIALGSYINHGGSLYKVEGADESITGTPADGKVYVRVTGSATLSASFISDISGYSYNHAYGSMTSGGYTLLPYVVVKAGNNWLKYRYDWIGQGGMVDQDLRTVDTPTFSKINVGRGETEVLKVKFHERVELDTMDPYNLPEMEVGEVGFFEIKCTDCEIDEGPNIKTPLSPDDGLAVYFCSALAGGGLSTKREIVTLIRDSKIIDLNLFYNLCFLLVVRQA